MFHPPTKKTDVDAMLHPADVPCGTKRKRDGHDAAEDPQLFWRAQLEAIYRRRNHQKLESIPGLLEKYQGHEAVLYRKVCEKYDLNPSKFHTDPEAWMEYDLTDHHGPKEGKTMVIETSEVFEVTVTNMSGTNSCKINDLQNSTVKQLLIRASAALKTQPWLSKLCLGSQKLSLDQLLCTLSLETDPSLNLTLVQEADPELDEALNRFMPGELENEGSVYVVWMSSFETAFNGLQESLALGVFRHGTDARDCVVEAASREYHEMMNQDFINGGLLDDIETTIFSTEKSISLTLPHMNSRKLWQVSKALLK